MKSLSSAKEAVEKLPFEGYNISVEVHTTTYEGHDALSIRLSGMYSSPTWAGEGGLVGMLNALNDATDTTNIDILHEHHESGCDTCDYGSAHGKTYVVWGEEE